MACRHPRRGVHVRDPMIDTCISPSLLPRLTSAWARTNIPAAALFAKSPPPVPRHSSPLLHHQLRHGYLESAEYDMLEGEKDPFAMPPSSNECSANEGDTPSDDLSSMSSTNSKNRRHSFRSNTEDASTGVRQSEILYYEEGTTEPENNQELHGHRQQRTSQLPPPLPSTPRHRASAREPCPAATDDSVRRDRSGRAIHVEQKLSELAAREATGARE